MRFSVGSVPSRTHLRHVLLARGVHPKPVQELLGHASIALTLDRYSHFTPDMGEQTTALG
jgi:site-specific recombinase XerD